MPSLFFCTYIIKSNLVKYKTVYGIREALLWWTYIISLETHGRKST
jgi:hypothetical protein